MKKEKLRIGILIDGYDILNWQSRILEEIKNSDFSELVLIIKNGASAVNRPFRFSRLLNNTNKIAFNLHLKLDEFILGRNADYSKTVNARTLLKNTDQITITPIEDERTNRIDDADINKIKKFDLDIILQFGFRTLTGAILNVAKYGVWLYSSDKNSELGYWEVIHRKKTTNTMLQILSEEPDKAKVIHHSKMLTNYVSISKNRNACYWRATTTVLRIIENIYNYGDAYLQKLENSNTKHTIDVISNRPPSSIRIMINIAKHFWKVSTRVVQKVFFKDHWDLLYKFNSNDASFPSLQDFKPLPASADRDWADPFVLTKGDKHYIFIEELLYKTNKGHIAVIELDKKGNLINSKKILEKPYHLSYPFVFSHENSYYMIPETGQNKTIELYKCIEFPYKWEFVMNLMENIYTADVTLFYYNNKWWLFCCVDKTGKDIGMLDELYLFFSDDLFTTNWQSHPNNPICTNTRTARPAGKIFLKDNKIYRPSQDCSGIYGRGFNINEITKLSETEYEESLITKIIPQHEDELKGTHTFNFNDKITVIDGFKHRRKLKSA